MWPAFWLMPHCAHCPCFVLGGGSNIALIMTSAADAKVETGG
jgi:hypothetical protein